MTRAALALGAGLLAVPVLVAVLVAGLLSAVTGGLSSASPAALADIPPDYLLLYQQAAADCAGLDWTLLAAIGKVESDHGRSTAPGVRAGENAAGAAGPMQFLQPTFSIVLAHHPLPAGGPTPPSRYNPHDAIHAAAAFLCDHHATTSPKTAVFAYNHDDTYVTAVLARAAAYRRPAAIRGGWPQQRADVPDPSGTGGYVTARAATLYDALTALDAIHDGATCWDPHLQNPDSDHPLGKACDVFFQPHDPVDVARGWTIARWLVVHQADYGVHYLIWQGLIWSTEHPSWATYYSPIYGCPNPTNLTGCHYNHIHVSIY